jgi:hypothetical protein
MYYINNSQEVSFDTLTNVPAEPTKDISPSKRWKPVPHHHLVELVKDSVTSQGIHQERYGLDKHRNLFGIIKLEREDHNNGTFRNVIGIRNSHNQDFSAQLVGGANVMVCDNLMFSGEFSDSRKHTTHVLRDLPQIVYSLTDKVVGSYTNQTCRYNGYRMTSIDKSDVADIMHDATRNDFAISGGQYNKVLNEYENPQHEEFEPGNAWSLFNAFTEIYKVYNGANVRKSINLHNVFDRHCSAAIEHEITSYNPSYDYDGDMLDEGLTAEDVQQAQNQRALVAK